MVTHDGDAGMMCDGGVGRMTCDSDVGGLRIVTCRENRGGVKGRQMIMIYEWGNGRKWQKQ